jgi:hypothetical protein
MLAPAIGAGIVSLVANGLGDTPWNHRNPMSQQHPKRLRARDAKGRFIKVVTLSAEDLDAAQALLVRLEDEQPTCLTIPYAVAVSPHFWGAGDPRPRKDGA